MEKLNEQDIYEILCQTFPKQNDYAESDYSEELQELLHFGINTKVKLLDLIVKHREIVLEQDEEELSEIDIRLSKEEYGEEFVNQRIENKFWFAYPALLRNVLELEFGEEYIEYADKRDNL